MRAQPVNVDYVARALAYVLENERDPDVYRVMGSEQIVPYVMAHMADGSDGPLM